MIWVKFKDFLRKNFGNFKVFVNSIWKKVKRNTQYQDKSVQDWAAYLKYLQSILIEFDLGYAPKKDTIIQNFQ